MTKETELEFEECRTEGTVRIAVDDGLAFLTPEVTAMGSQNVPVVTVVPRHIDDLTFAHAIDGVERMCYLHDDHRFTSSDQAFGELNALIPDEMQQFRDGARILDLCFSEDEIKIKTVIYKRGQPYLGEIETVCPRGLPLADFGAAVRAKLWPDG